MLLAFALSFMFAPPEEAAAQNAPVYIYAFNLDTLTNTETVTFEFPKKFENNCIITWNVVDTELSGTATNTVTVEQSVCNTCSDAWVVTDTLATITATGAYATTLTAEPNLTADNRLWGYRVRLKASNSGTGVHSLKVYAIVRRKDF